mgnify:CR=1 FL=1
MAIKQHRIALLIEQGFGARVIIQTGILKTLVDNNLDPVILTSGPNSIKTYLKTTPFHCIPVHKLETSPYNHNSNKTIIRILRMVRLFSLKTRTVSDLLEMEIKDSKNHPNINNKIVTSIVRVLVLVAKLHPVIIHTLVLLENKLSLVKANQSFFETFKPDALLTTSLGTFDHDAYVLREASNRNIKTISYILSWDNTTVRGFGTNLTSHIITWSDIMKTELITLHHKKPEMIYVGGVPHYDSYNEPSKLWTRKELDSNLNIPTKKNIILLGTKSPNTYQSNPYIANLICEIIKKRSELDNYMLLVRLHPIYYRAGTDKLDSEEAEWQRLLEYYGPEIILLDRPEIIGDDLRYFMSDKEITKLGSILRHSAIVVNMFSTLNIESSIFDTPTINVNFQDPTTSVQGYKQARFDIAADARQTHNLRVTEYQATVVANEPADLEKLLIKSIHNPQDNSIGRKKLVESECSAHLGNAAKHIGELMSKLVKA